MIIQKTSECLWQYSRNEPALSGGNIVDFDGDNITDPFRFKAVITGTTNEVGAKDAEVALLLKHLSNIWRTFEISLINCETNLILTLNGLQIALFLLLQVQQHLQ